MSGKLITTRLELRNYVRISLNDFSKFIYTPDDQIALQIILGRNGCGKSSLQNELWPLPGARDDFTAGGLKDHTVEYNNRSYRIVSDFTGTGKGVYEFWCDGVNLNEGGKIEMCRSLCFEHFGVNEEIRALALGRETLTQMGPARRRYWMVKLADSDFTYSIRAYNALKDAHRDATGSLRRLNKRLVDETTKLVDKAVSDEINRETSEIKELIKELYGQRNATVGPSSDALNELAANSVEIDRMCNSAERFNLEVLTTSGCDNIDDLNLKIRELTFKEREIQSLNQHVYSEHTKVKKKHELMSRAGTESLTELNSKLQTLESEVSHYRGSLVYPSVELVHSAVETQSVFEHLYDDLFDKLSNLPSNESGYYSSDKKAMLERENRWLHEESMKLERTILKYSADIEHREAHVLADSFTCPQCNHSWTLKATEENIAKVKEKIGELKVKQTEHQEKAKKNAEYLEEFSVFDALYRGILLIINNHRILSPYFNMLCSGNRLMQYPSSMATDLYSVRRDLENHVQIQKNETQIAKIKEQIELKTSMDAESIEVIEKELHELEQKLSQYQTLQLTYRNQIRDLGGIVSLYQTVEGTRKDMRRLHDQSLALGKQYAYSRYQELLTYSIMGLQTQLARKEDALAAITHQQQIVDDIRYQIDSTAMQERVAKAAHQALSPTNGAIAEGLRRFNNIYVNRMNKVIGAIWSYPLEIQATAMEDGQVEMDYKFPFVRNGKGRPFKDVDEGSESMLNIFDFAFRICAMRQLGLGHLPLFLDEFESKFDVAHREAAVYFIKRLLDEDHYGQIFMVSHYDSTHGALSNLGQICVIDPQNVMLSSEAVVNKNATFE